MNFLYLLSHTFLFEGLKEFFCCLSFSFDPICKPERQTKKIDDAVMGCLTDSVSFCPSVHFPATFSRLHALNCICPVFPLNKAQLGLQNKSLILFCCVTTDCMGFLLYSTSGFVSSYICSFSSTLLPPPDFHCMSIHVSKDIFVFVLRLHQCLYRCHGSC